MMKFFDDEGFSLKPKLYILDKLRLAVSERKFFRHLWPSLSQYVVNPNLHERGRFLGKLRSGLYQNCMKR